MKVYKIRLNAEDAKYGIQSKESRRQLAEKGIDYSQLAIDAWKAAVDSTKNAIFTSLPKEMQADIVKMRETLPQVRKDARCTRCGGSGYRDDIEYWILLNDGKKCFKCMGSGIETGMEPVFFRRRVVDTLRNATIEQAESWANKVYTDWQHVYRPVLMDIVNLILEGKVTMIYKLPH